MTRLATMSADELSGRINQLQVRLTRMRILGSAALGVGFLGLALAFANRQRNNPHYDSVTVGRLVLKNSDGTKVGEWESYPRGSLFTLCDGSGDSTVLLGSGADESFLLISSESGIAARIEADKDAATMSVHHWLGGRFSEWKATSDTVNLVLRDRDFSPLAELVLLDDESVTLRLGDKDGKPRLFAALDPEGKPGLGLLDAEKKMIWFAP